MTEAPIVANSVLPARRAAVSLRTADGLQLNGELAVPVAVAPVATLVCLHPLPTAGGSMQSHVFRKMAWRLPALAGVAVFRFNLRSAGAGAERSDGEFDECRSEGLDLGAALAEVVRRDLPEPWLVGWSFGTDVALKHGARDPVAGAVLLSPPLRFADDADLARWARRGTPLVAVVPEFDDYLRPDEARRRFAAIPQAQVRAVPQAGHLWVGERFVTIVLNEIVRAVVPAAFPLPTDWAGPMDRWSDL